MAISFGGEVFCDFGEWIINLEHVKEHASDKHVFFRFRRRLS